MNRIKRIIFDDLVPIDQNVRAVEFETDGGWTIIEVEPGRIELKRGLFHLVVQDHAYTLHLELTPPSEPAVKPQRGRSTKPT